MAIVMNQQHTDILAEVSGPDIDTDTEQYLSEMRLWTKFVSLSYFIIGLLCAGILIFFHKEITLALNAGIVLFGIHANPEMTFWLIIFLVLCGFGIFIFPFLFSRKVRSALQTKNAADLASAFNYARIYFILITVAAGLSLVLKIFSYFK